MQQGLKIPSLHFLIHFALGEEKNEYLDTNCLDEKGGKKELHLQNMCTNACTGGRAQHCFVQLQSMHTK